MRFHSISLCLLLASSYSLADTHLSQELRSVPEPASTQQKSDRAVGLVGNVLWITDYLKRNENGQFVPVKD